VIDGVVLQIRNEPGDVDDGHATSLPRTVTTQCTMGVRIRGHRDCYCAMRGQVPGGCRSIGVTW
jgi:hypothetical protein